MPETICWNPADYAEHSQGQERWAKELLDLLQLQKNECVLDIGCAMAGSQPRSHIAYHPAR